MSNLALKLNNTSAKIDYEISTIGWKYIKGIRSSNYEYKTSLAEQIDNSEDAGATEVRVDFVEEKKNKMDSIIIVDNGHGMSYGELKNSFSLGADGDYSKNANGKFGMGGTNGSLALAKVKVTVTKNNGEYNIRKYDLEEVKSRDTWGSFPISPDGEYGSYFTNLLDKYLKKMKSSTGTLIFLTDLDRMTNKNIGKVSQTLVSHYGKTYYASIYTESLKIFVNNIEVSYTDPLKWRDETTIQLIDDYIIKPQDGNSGIRIKAVSMYNAPTTRGNFQASGGYIFRNNRLIESGIFKNSKWPHLWERTQNKRDIRWAIFFHEDSDDLMSVSNSKDSVNPPEDFVSRVSDFLLPHAKHYADLRDNRDKSQDPIQSKEDLDKLSTMADTILKDNTQSNPSETIGKSKDSESPNDPTYNTTPQKKGLSVSEAPCGKYLGPMVIELDLDPDSQYKHSVKINTNNDFIKNHYNNKSSETKEALRILLLSTSWSLYSEKLRAISDELCELTIDNVEEKFIGNLRRLTRKHDLN